MGEDGIKRAADMLLGGATMLAEPCPYCSGVRVLKDGHALCASCGSEPERRTVQQEAHDAERQVLELTRQLGSETDPEIRRRILAAITRLSEELASGAVSGREA